MATIKAYEDRIRAAVGDLGSQQRLRSEEIQFALERALVTLGADAPRRVTETFAGDGSTYDLTFTNTTPDDFRIRSSEVISVEYPTGNRTPTLLEERDYGFPDPDVATLRLFNETPSTGKSVKVTYTTPLYPYPDDTASTDLVPDGWFEAVCYLAAAEILETIASRNARGGDHFVAGERVPRPADPLWESAKRHRALYRKIVLDVEPAAGAGGPAPKPPSLVVNDVDVFPATVMRRRL